MKWNTGSVSCGAPSVLAVPRSGQQWLLAAGVAHLLHAYNQSRNASPLIHIGIRIRSRFQRLFLVLATHIVLRAWVGTWSRSHRYHQMMRTRRPNSRRGVLPQPSRLTRSPIVRAFEVRGVESNKFGTGFILEVTAQNTGQRRR